MNKITIIGGANGTLLAVNLIKNADESAPIKINLIKKKRDSGAALLTQRRKVFICSTFRRRKWAHFPTTPNIFKMRGTTAFLKKIKPTDDIFINGTGLTLGTALKGVLWESTAMPEICAQARSLALSLLDGERR